MITYLDTCHTLLPDSKLISDDDNACTICYAFPIAAIFKPCNHQTCRTCIERHLLNTRECFFCKTIIEKVEDLSGNTLHDFTSEFPISKVTSWSSDKMISQIAHTVLKICWILAICVEHRDPTKLPHIIFIVQ